MKILTVQFSSTFYHFSPLRSKYSPQHPILKHLQSRPYFLILSHHYCSWFYVFPLYKRKKGKVVPVLNLIKHYAMKTYGGVDV
jgi:hypothetical protein